MATSALSFAFPLAAQVWLVQMLAYHGFGLWFEWLDRAGRLSRFKTRPLERMSYGRMVPRVLANQVFVLLPAMLLMQWTGLAFVGRAHLSLLDWLVAAVALPLGHDVVQYVAHRFILHRPDMMRRLGHALHHSTTGRRGISACYMSATDFFFEIVCPYLLPLALIGGGGSDLVFHTVMVVSGAFGGLYEHSGYDFSLGLRDSGGGWLRAALAKMTSSEAHAAHHVRGNVSFSDGFGSPSLCDTLFGTRFDLVPGRGGYAGSGRRANASA